MFKITFGTGFHMSFKNGYTVSVQFGERNYCDHDYTPAPNAEVAVLKNGKFVTGWPHSNDGDDVAGWLTSDQVLDVMNYVSKL